MAVVKMRVQTGTVLIVRVGTLTVVILIVILGNISDSNSIDSDSIDSDSSDSDSKQFINTFASFFQTLK